MSRLGKTAIALPKGVEIKVEGDRLMVKGPKGSLTTSVVKGISFKVEGDFVTVEKDEQIKLPKTTHGLYRATLNNMVMGVSQGFQKELSMVGVGYRAAVQGSVIDLQVGFSHKTQVTIPKGIEVAIDKGVSIVIKGTDKQAVGQFAATIRAVKPPEPYKGKGIRYKDEYVRKKAGKAAKAKTAAG